MRFRSQFHGPAAVPRTLTVRLFQIAAIALTFSACALPPEKSSRGAADVFVEDGYVETSPLLGPKGYLLKSIARDVYFFSTGVYNTMFVATSEGVILIDPIRDQGEALKKAIRETTALPVKFLIYSHAHLDHIGDAYLFSNDAQVIAQKETTELLKLYKDPYRPVPNISFGERYSLTLGGIQVDLIYPGEGHGKGNIVVHLPQRKVLMYVDVATPRAVPHKNFGTIDIYRQIKGIEQALALDFTVYVAGHLHRPGTREEMKEVLDYHYASKRANAMALKKVSFEAVRARSKTRDAERLLGEYYDAVAEVCYQILKKDWKPRLMGFEAFTRGHCDVWTEYHRTHVAPAAVLKPSAN